MNKFSLQFTLGKPVSLLALLIGMACAPAYADVAAEVAKLMRAGQFSEALARTDAHLAKNPRDPQIRFMKGVILTEQNKTSEAVNIFTRLTQDYPNLPEPYNNLAVLHAAAGQYEKARAALDAAIRTNPSYATAYENLGDVHAKLASQAYDKALQLDSANSGAKSKLTLVRSMVGTDTVIANAAPASASAAPKVATPAPKPEPKPAVESKPAPAPVKQPEKAAEKLPQVANAKVEPSKPAPKPEVDTARADVMKAVDAWAKAWAAQDLKGYFGAYRSDYAPAGQTRKAWEDERRSRIIGRNITVRLENPEVTVKGDSATVRFRQIYSAGSVNFNSRKTLVMDKQGNRWLIRQERTGS